MKIRNEVSSTQKAVFGQSVTVIKFGLIVACKIIVEALYTSQGCYLLQANYYNYYYYYSKLHLLQLLLLLHGYLLLLQLLLLLHLHCVLLILSIN